MIDDGLRTERYLWTADVLKGNNSVMMVSCGVRNTLMRRKTEHS
jgi:hypothetical protein